VVEAGGAEQRIEFDVLLCAVGRSARLKGFGLEELGIPVQRTVQVNEYLQTATPTSWPRATWPGPTSSRTRAAHQAWYAAVNGLFGSSRSSRPTTR
jgi:pyruvate/2-oxoglutarate dehydrogenase complex dihydrolipoamide dehydrogenase (E3) component